MAKTIMIVGFGPGTATAVAEKFGGKGLSVALIGRSQERLAAGVIALKAQGVDAYAFPADAGDPASIRSAVQAVQSQLGIDVLHWNAYGGVEAGDLLTADEASVHKLFDVAVFGLIAATEEAIPELKKNGGAVMISNGAFGLVSPEMDAVPVNLHVMGLALSSAAKHKLAGMLAERLKGEGIFVGEVMVHGTIKGPAAPDGIDPAVIADKHWQVYESRTETRASVK
ncbi:MAG TPA: SDR family NAD(P)-dependent oxidoreductase [Candidatus Rubrimentiphilum sp.]|nr:SDR family NAD(P)-dependent oxidoreductase [Candidatus Rubrimentiphilum sp.]